MQYILLLFFSVTFVQSIYNYIPEKISVVTIYGTSNFISLSLSPPPPPPS